MLNNDDLDQKLHRNPRGVSYSTVPDIDDTPPLVRSFVPASLSEYVIPT